MSKKRKIDYNVWGYIFLIPFFVVYVIFQLIPLINTVTYSMYEFFKDQGFWVGPTFIGFQNYIDIFAKGDIWIYFKNTMIMWIMGFIPQILVALLLGAWFSDNRLRLKCSGFFKTVIYMPNLIMAAALAMLFYALFADLGPINSILMTLGIIDEPFKFLSHTWGARGLVAFMNFLMWFGNTTILLMAGMMGIDSSLYEAAEVDGATSTQRFFRITLPLLKPILIYVMVTCLIGGLQMFDVPQILTNGSGAPVNTTKTLIMYLNNQIATSKNYGMGGTISVIMFVITAILSLIVFKMTGYKDED